jgi:TRAP-type C4-dicarboxylate transport system permease small subunit
VRGTAARRYRVAGTREKFNSDKRYGVRHGREMLAMKRLTSALGKVIEISIVLLLAGMAAMIFLNVVLRYGFNSGLVISEEMSRFFFVWLTFIGAVLAFAENAHLGVETMVRLFGRRGRIICMALSNALILLCVAVLFWGTWLQAPNNITMRSPVAGLPLAYVFGVTFFTALGIGVIAIWRLFKILTGRVTDAEIAHFVGDYDSVDSLLERGE